MLVFSFPAQPGCSLIRCDQLRAMSVLNNIPQLFLGFSYPIPNEAKNKKKKATATDPKTYESPPFSDNPIEIAMPIQQIEQAAAEHIMTFLLP